MEVDLVNRDPNNLNDHIKVSFFSVQKKICSKTCLKRPLKKKTKMVFKTENRLMLVKSIAECSNGSILQYFRPSQRYTM